MKMFLCRDFCCFVSFMLCLLANQAQAGYIGGEVGAGLHAAGLLGSYAGTLSGGHALSELQLDKIGDAAGEVEAHDFSDDVENNESVGHLGDHLDEHSFPSDYGSSSDDGHAVEYSEAEAEAEASEHYDAHSLSLDHHQDIDFHQQHDFDEHESISHLNELSHEHEDLQLHDHHEDYHDSKPVPGIDHGKGAFSYSTTYEFKDKHNEDEFSY